MDKLSRSFRDKGAPNYNELDHRRGLREEASAATNEILGRIQSTIGKLDDGEDDGPFACASFPFSDEFSLVVEQGVSEEILTEYLYHAFCHRDGLEENMPEPVTGIGFDRGSVASLLDFPDDRQILSAITFATGMAAAQGGTISKFEHCGITIDVPDGADEETILRLFKRQAAEILRMRAFRHGNRDGIQVIQPGEPDDLS